MCMIEIQSYTSVVSYSTFKEPSSMLWNQHSIYEELSSELVYLVFMCGTWKSTLGRLASMLIGSVFMSVYWTRMGGEWGSTPGRHEIMSSKDSFYDSDTRFKVWGTTFTTESPGDLDSIHGMPNCTFVEPGTVIGYCISLYGLAGTCCRTRYHTLRSRFHT